jgi:ATP-dependent exoDNAse (exonuclease V) beta subunit
MVTLDSDTHIYTNEKNEPYISVSQILKNFQEPFDPNGYIAKAVAKKRKVHVSQVQREWRETGNVANEHGTNVHTVLQTYLETGKIPDKDDSGLVYVESLKELEFNGKLECEVILSNDKYKIAGTTDLKEKYKKRFNLWDYKTNKDITFYSKYDKTFFPPIQHLEDCKFNYYALQLSFYAWLCESNGETIGRLGILWFNPIDKKITVYNVPYMRYEIDAIVNSTDFKNTQTKFFNEIKKKYNV